MHSTKSNQQFPQKQDGVVELKLSAVHLILIRSNLLYNTQSWTCFKQWKYGFDWIRGWRESQRRLVEYIFFRSAQLLISHLYLLNLRSHINATQQSNQNAR